MQGLVPAFLRFLRPEFPRPISEGMKVRGLDGGRIFTYSLIHLTQGAEYLNDESADNYERRHESDDRRDPK